MRLPCRPAQFAEETKGADRVVPRGIVWSVVGTAVLGSSYLLTLLFCIQVRYKPLASSICFPSPHSVPSCVQLLLAKPCSHLNACEGQF